MTDISWNENEQLFVHHEDGREWSSSGRRFFSRGGVKYALLELLTIEPMHGYQMIKHLEEQSAGTYKPSAGTIYPTLQLLSDQGLVSAKKEAGKKIFEITEDGRTFLQQEREAHTDAAPVEESSLHGGRGGARIMSGREMRHPDHEWSMRGGRRGDRFMHGGDPRGRHHSHAAYGREDRGHADSEHTFGEHDKERGRGRNRRLTPAGKELFHQLKAAERVAMEDQAKAERLRGILNELKEALRELTEGKRA